MCLINYDNTIRIAEKPIRVFKELDSENRSTVQGHPYAKYKKNPIVPLQIIQLSDGATRIVNRGYHSYKHHQRIYYRDTITRANSLFIIPKGASYIEGVHSSDRLIDNYVSSEIIYLGRVNLFNRLIAWLVFGTKFKNKN